jgi:predicted transcriptional regulator of viral defense system
MTHSSRKANRQLFALALAQGGYFSAKQARQVGYDYPHLDYHVSVGNFVRIGHGLYRLPALPPAEHDDLIRLTLWSRNRQDQPQAVISYASALVVHDLSDLLPTKTHLTVPPAFRKRAPKGCLLHKQVLPDKDVEERQGFRVTTPFRTIQDAAIGDVSREELEKAVGEALKRGLVRRGKLEAAIRGDPALHRLAAILIGAGTQP